MKAFNKLDLSSLKAFYFAAQELNFTRAAETAGLTQSGISQHIQKLEEELGTPLFQRNKKQMRLTDAGHELRNFIENYLDSVESLYERLHTQGTSLRGKVRYAMPDSCLYTPHMAMLLERRTKEFPGIELKVHICDSEEVVALLQQGEVDFGFITKSIADRSLNFQEFAREEYVLVGQKKNLVLRSPKDLHELTFINYPGMDALFDHWFAFEFPKSRPIRLKELKVAGEINSLRGALKMVEGGMGLGIFQRHCITPSLDAKTIFAHSTKQARYENPIFLVTPKNVRLPSRVRATVNAFWDMKKS